MSNYILLFYIDIMDVITYYFFNPNAGLTNLVITSILICGMKLLFQTWTEVTVEVWELKSNFIPYVTVHVLTYPCWD